MPDDSSNSQWKWNKQKHFIIMTIIKHFALNARYYAIALHCTLCVWKCHGDAQYLPSSSSNKTKMKTLIGYLYSVHCVYNCCLFWKMKLCVVNITTTRWALVSKNTHIHFESKTTIYFHFKVEKSCYYLLVCFWHCVRAGANSIATERHFRAWLFN